jgi:hypothetical protein
VKITVSSREGEVWTPLVKVEAETQGCSTHPGTPKMSRNHLRLGRPGIDPSALEGAGPAYAGCLSSRAEGQ